MRDASASLLDLAPCGFVAFDDAGTIATANTTLARLLGEERADLIGRAVESILTVPSRIFYQTHFFPLIKLHGHADEIYLTLRTAAGETVPVFASAVRAEYEGRLLNHCALLPLREREKYEAELLRAKKAAEETERAKSVFLSTMSHELRTPINAILGYADLLDVEIEGALSEGQRRYLAGLREASRHLLNLVTEVLDLAKIEAGSMTVSTEPLPLADAIRHAVALVEPQAVSAGLTLALRCAPHGLTYLGDEGRVTQILVNLLSNAVKFTGPGGEIGIECGTTTDGAAVYTCVRDTGVGISQEQIERIFRPFVQADAHAAGGKGTGLGLTISRHFAELMGGSLSVESEVGKGSAFTLRLPTPDAG